MFAQNRQNLCARCVLCMLGFREILDWRKAARKGTWKISWKNQSHRLESNHLNWLIMELIWFRLCMVNLVRTTRHNFFNLRPKKYIAQKLTRMLKFSGQFFCSPMFNQRHLTSNSSAQNKFPDLLYFSDICREMPENVYPCTCKRPVETAAAQL